MARGIPNFFIEFCWVAAAAFRRVGLASFGERMSKVRRHRKWVLSPRIARFPRSHTHLTMTREMFTVCILQAARILGLNDFMNEAQNPFKTLQTFDLGNGRQGSFHSLPQLEKSGVGPISKLPVSIRIVLESVLRNCDGKKVSEASVRELANWQPNAARTEEIPFVVARIVLQDFTGVPLLVDLA